MWGRPDVFLRKQDRAKWRDLTPNHWKAVIDARVSFDNTER